MKKRVKVKSTHFFDFSTMIERSQALKRGKSQVSEKSTKRKWNYPTIDDIQIHPASAHPSTVVIST
jgi:hypothetical protein